MENRENKLELVQTPRELWYQAGELLKKGDRENGRLLFHKACQRKNELQNEDNNLVQWTLNYADIFAPIEVNIAADLAHLYTTGIPNILCAQKDKKELYEEYFLRLVEPSVLWQRFSQEQNVHPTVWKKLNDILLIHHASFDDQDTESENFRKKIQEIRDKIIGKLDKQFKKESSADAGCLLAQIYSTICARDYSIKQRPQLDSEKKQVEAFKKALNTVEMIQKDFPVRANGQLYDQALKSVLQLNIGKWLPLMSSFNSNDSSISFYGRKWDAILARYALDFIEKNGEMPNGHDLCSKVYDLSSPQALFLQNIIEFETNKLIVGRYESAVKVIHHVVSTNDSQSAFLVAKMLSTDNILFTVLNQNKKNGISDQFVQLVLHTIDKNPIEVMLLVDQAREFMSVPGAKITLKNDASQSSAHSFSSFLLNYINNDFDKMMVDEENVAMEFLPFIASMYAYGNGKNKSIERAVSCTDRFLEKFESNQSNHSSFVMDHLLDKCIETFLNVEKQSPEAMDMSLKLKYTFAKRACSPYRIFLSMAILKKGLLTPVYGEIWLKHLDSFKTIYQSYINMHPGVQALFGEFELLKYQLSEGKQLLDEKSEREKYLLDAIKFFDHALTVNPTVCEDFKFYTRDEIKRKKVESLVALARGYPQTKEFEENFIVPALKSAIVTDPMNRAPIVYCMERYVKSKGEDDIRLLVDLLEYAAINGNSEIQFQLGCAYGGSQSIDLSDEPPSTAGYRIVLKSKHYAKAMFFLNLACNGGNGEASDMLGHMYRCGNDACPKDLDKAISYFKKAYDQKCQKSLINQALTHLEKKDFINVSKCLEGKLTQSDCLAMRKIIRAVLHDEGLGTNKSSYHFLNNMVFACTENLAIIDSKSEIVTMLNNFDIFSRLEALKKNEPLASYSALQLEYLSSYAAGSSETRLQIHDKIYQGLKTLQKSKETIVALLSTLSLVQMQFAAGVAQNNPELIHKSYEDAILLIKQMPINLNDFSEIERAMLQAVIYKTIEYRDSLTLIDNTLISEYQKNQYLENIKKAVSKNATFQLVTVIQQAVDKASSTGKQPIIQFTTISL